MRSFTLNTAFFEITADSQSFLSVKGKTEEYSLSSPVFEIDGWEEAFVFSACGSTRKLKNNGTLNEIIYKNKDGSLQLCLQLKTYENAPVLRFRYEVTANRRVAFTKKDGCDNILYTGLSIKDDTALEEIQLAQHIAHIHSYAPVFQDIDKNALVKDVKKTGPVVLLKNNSSTCLLAYEHGAAYPDGFLSFVLNKNNVKIIAEKGNYCNGMECGPEKPFKSVWFEFGMVDGTREDMLKAYRNFMLSCICENAESRKPYIFYNTWNYQERSRYFLKRGFIEDMTFDRVCLEIEAAHKMGIEVFVIDTGWFSKTGDWIVNSGKFPDGMCKVKELLDGYGMKLGLWFNPTVAAVTSKIVTEHPEYRISIDGEINSWEVWESERSYGMCLCSDYWEFFADTCIRLYKELGVRYFKWDGVDQYGCNSPLHDHGDESNSIQERGDCYSYGMGLRMIEIVEKLQEECPDVIVDFDVTEANRFVGLGFLAAGKYFLINNGPYAKEFDIPEDFNYLQEKPVTIDPFTNIFFFPGAARPRFCRQGTRYDSLIPSVLFLTHFLPDPPLYSQKNSFASLVLGGNGIWGDLSALSDEDIGFFTENIALYKKVREYVTASYPIVSGEIGTSPEIHEKIDPSSGKGLICFFTCFKGAYTYITQKLEVMPEHVNGAKSYEVLENGRLSVTVELDADSAEIVFLY